MRIIAHIDMDAFFASVEEREKPWLKGLPIVVGADPEGGEGRGVAATANYKAREYGIYSATPITRAWRFSEEARKSGKPGVVFITPTHGKYGATSKRIMEIVEGYAEVVEKRSIDEAYLDISDLGSYTKAKKHISKLKSEIKEKEKLTCSVGIGPNKMIAKIASEYKKPDGITIVRLEDVRDFLLPLPVGKIPGIGVKTDALLGRHGVKSIGDMERFSKEELIGLFGRYGASFYNKARGKDDSPLVLEWQVKSIGEQETYREDTFVMNDLLASLKGLCGGVYKRFARKGFKGFRTVVLTVRFSDFQTQTRSQTLLEPLISKDELELQTMRLLMPFFDKRENPHHKKIRLLGVRIEKLQE